MRAARTANARLAAIDAIAAVLDHRQSLSDSFLPENKTGNTALSERDLAFARRLTFGVLRWLNALEWLAARLLRSPLKRRDRDIHRLLLLGLYQLWKDETPDHAAVHATTECVKHLDKSWATGLVNALLRRFLRERKTLLEELASTPEIHAHPSWLLKRLQQDWPQDWPSIVNENNRQAPLWLRVNRRRADPEEMLAEFGKQGYEAATHPRACDAISVQAPVAVTRLPGFGSGRISVQDPAAQLAVDHIAPAPGERVLDACAAPGGKTCHLLERERGIELLALDRSEKRLSLIADSLKRLGLKCKLECADAGRPGDWWDGTLYDKILLDAPCSATGVIRRHPEIKWLRDPAQCDKAAAGPRRLLERLWPLLETGGILVYATCSILKSENHAQIQEFLSRHADAVCTVHPRGTEKQGPHPGQILPGEEGMDGFYYAIIHKSG